MSDLKKIKICTQKILDIHKPEMDLINSHTPENQKKLRAAFFTKKLWTPGSTITIGFLATGENIKRRDLSSSQDIDPLEKVVSSLSVQEAIKKIVNERIQPLVNLNFSFIENPSNAIVRISFDQDGGAWSLVGTDHMGQKDGATMNLGWFDVPTTIHEFGHLLGLIHEHQNPNGKTIMWDKPKVLEWAKETQGWSESTTEENIINKYDKNSINGSDFDPLSIMLYFFPSSLTTNNSGTQQNFRLSGEDVMWISKTYHKEDGVSPEVFYQNTYGTSLQSSIDKSKMLSDKFNNPNSNYSNWKNIVFGVCGVLLIILIIVLVLKFRRKREIPQIYNI
jgi:hypothetical protein